MMRLVDRLGFPILPHVGIRHCDAVMRAVVEVEGRGFPVDLHAIGAKLGNVGIRNEPIRPLPAIVVAEHLGPHGDIDRPIVEMTNRKAHFASGRDGGVFFAHGFYSMGLWGLSMGQNLPTERFSKWWNFAICSLTSLASRTP